MTGLDQEQVDWLYEQLAQMVEWEASTGRPRVLPLYTALVMVLFALRQNLAPDVLGEVFGCGSTTVERYQDELETLIDMVLSPLYEQIRAQAHRDAVLVDGLVVPIGERDGIEGLGAFGLRDAAFHDLVALSAENEVIREALARLHTHVHLFRLVHDTQVTHLAMAEHEEVVAAIAARDPDAAAYAMRRHILLSGERFRRLFDEAKGADGMAVKA